MHTCIDMGITTFDTAEIYGRTVCETLMGKAFKKDPTLIKRIELVTKTGIFEKEISGEKSVTTTQGIQELCNPAKKV